MTSASGVTGSISADQAEGGGSRPSGRSILELLKRIIGLDLCCIGNHAYYSYSEDMDNLPADLKPNQLDSTSALLRKFHEAARLRCRRCPYTYPEQ